MRVFWNVLFWVGITGFGNLQAQNCDGIFNNWSIPGSKPTFLTLITGYHDRPSTNYWESVVHDLEKASGENTTKRAIAWLLAGKSANSSNALAPRLSILAADSTLDSTTVARLQVETEVGAMAALAQGKPKAASELLARVTDMPAVPVPCRIRTEQLMVGYLLTYGMEAPLFPHFNGGFYNYLEDSLRWKPKAPDGNGYLMALNVVAMALFVDQQRQALYMELLGDLLSKEPNRFNANYMSSLAYMRAGMLAGGAAKDVYDRKAIFALEAPRQAEYRFNQYRFTQLQKALQDDVDSARVWNKTNAATRATIDPFERFDGKIPTSMISSTFEVGDPGKLAAILQKSRSQLEDRLNENKRYAGDVDLKKEVKKDARFNAFALFLILTIVAAIVFIWRKVRKGAAS